MVDRKPCVARPLPVRRRTWPWAAIPARAPANDLSPSAASASASGAPTRRTAAASARERGAMDSSGRGQAGQGLGSARKASAWRWKNRTTPVELEAVSSRDPLPGVLALDASGYALAGGDAKAAGRWARHAASGAIGRRAHGQGRGRARQGGALHRAGPRADPSRIRGGLRALIAALRAQKLEPPSGGHMGRSAARRTTR